MNSDRRRMDPEMLHDYVDNQLDAETRLEVARHIGENPLDAALVQAYRDQNEALQRLYGPTAEEPVPQRLLDAVEKACLENERGRRVGVTPRARPGRRVAWTASLVVVLTLCLGGVVGWWGRGIQEAGLTRQAVLNAFLDQAVQSYTLYAGSAREPVDAPMDDVKKFTDWFKDQLDVRVLAPQLGAGFKLVGARILPTAFGTAGQLVYADQSGQRVAVYMQVAAAAHGNSLAPASQFAGDVAFVRHGQFSVYYWAADNVAYALVSPLDQNALGSVMKKILNPGDGDNTSPAPSSAPSKTRA